MLKNKGLIKNGHISKNKAKKGGGGIFNEGQLILEKAKIYLNSCDEYGGGIFYNGSKFIYDKNKI